MFQPSRNRSQSRSRSRSRSLSRSRSRSPDPQAPAAGAAAESGGAAPAEEEDINSEEFHEKERNALREFLASIPLTNYTEMLLENEVTVDALSYFESSDFKDLGIAKGCSIKIKAQLRKEPWKQMVADKDGAG